MTFIISNISFENSIKRDNFYFITNNEPKIYENANCLMIFEGFLYSEQTDITDLFNNIIQFGINEIKKEEGSFSGVFMNKKSKEIYLFHDRYGQKDIYYYISKENFIITTEFQSIFKFKTIDLQIDSISLLEFLLFEYPLFNRTFIKNLRILAMGTILCYNLNNNKKKIDKYFDYTFKTNSSFDLNRNSIFLCNILDEAMEKIVSFHEKDKIYGLGLSGGLDSRLVAYYALKKKINLVTFIFGDPKSDAFHIARKLKKILNIEHHKEITYDSNFYQFCKICFDKNPMMNLLYAWYYATIVDLPKFNILLTGYNGDNQFGSHLTESDLKIKNHKQFTSTILKKYVEIGNYEEIIKYWKNEEDFLIIKKKINQFSKNSKNSLYWQKKEEFNYKNRQRIFIKNNPSLSYFGKFPSYSLFSYPKFIDLMLIVPFRYRINLKFFYFVLKSNFPFLYNLRPAGKISLKVINKKIFTYFIYFVKKIDNLTFNIIFKRYNKRFELWLSQNEDFRKYLKKEFFPIDNEFKNLIEQNLFNKILNKKKWNNNEIQLLFRFLTINKFLEKISHN